MTKTNGSTSIRLRKQRYIAITIATIKLHNPNLDQQTYYLSIELSYPEFRGSVNTPNPGRAQYHKQWHESTNAAQTKSVGGTEAVKGKEPQRKQDEDETMRDQDEDQDAPGEMVDIMIDPQLGHQVPMAPSQSTADHAITQRNDTNEAAAEDDIREQQSNEEHGAPVRAQDPAENDTEPEPSTSHDIQILDLHSDRPYISYRGKVFEGEWAEVMGTELILAQHEQGGSLPVLRQLAQDVDLFAASSSRITTKEKIPKSKDMDDDDLADIKDEWSIKVPAGKDKTGERARQARFLESIMALKKKKGQQDQVTVFATRVDEQDFADDANPDQKPPQRKKRPTEKRERTQPLQRAGSQSSNPFAGRRVGGGRAPRRSRALIDSLSAVSEPTPATFDEMNRSTPRGDVTGAQRHTNSQPPDDTDAMDTSPPT